MYKCADCGKPVIKNGDDIIRICSHTGSITADMSAQVFAHGSLQN